MEAEKFYDEVTQEILKIILDIPLLHEFDQLNVNAYTHEREHLFA